MDPVYLFPLLFWFFFPDHMDASLTMDHGVSFFFLPFFRFLYQPHGCHVANHELGIFFFMHHMDAALLTMDPVKLN
jgi:hypothetical protein